MVGRDLMIGDWVKIIDPDRYAGAIGKISSLTSLEGAYFAIDIQDVHYGYLITDVFSEDIVPIPLTQEILVRNNFHHIQGGAWDYFSIKGIEWFDLYKEENGFALHIGQSEVYLNYVHELQHALRLCKIEKEIEL